jgi:hypothetical protein
MIGQERNLSFFYSFRETFEDLFRSFPQELGDSETGVLVTEHTLHNRENENC